MLVRILPERLLLLGSRNFCPPVEPFDLCNAQISSVAGWGAALSFHPCLLYLVRARHVPSRSSVMSVWAATPADRPSLVARTAAAIVDRPSLGRRCGSVVSPPGRLPICLGRATTKPLSGTV